jgi:hypothetical protein
MDDAGNVDAPSARIAAHRGAAQRILCVSVMRSTDVAISIAGLTVSVTMSGMASLLGDDSKHGTAPHPQPALPGSLRAVLHSTLIMGTQMRASVDTHQPSSARLTQYGSHEEQARQGLAAPMS